MSYGINSLNVRSNLLYLTLPSDVYVKEAILALLGHFMWFKVGLLSSTEEKFLKVCETWSLLSVYAPSTVAIPYEALEHDVVRRCGPDNIF